MVNPFLNRREFIGATAVAGAGLLLNACKSDSGQKAAPAKNPRSTPSTSLSSAMAKKARCCSNPC